MALVPGTRLGHYEVVAPLGAGGMGEVYRARDTRRGAKLLDFGLARSSGEGSLAAGPEEEATEAKPLTAAGTVLGTYQYMAPEQLAGLEASPWTDIFALGTVLYEMATGRRAFEGKSKTSLVAAILSAQPQAIGWTAWKGDAPSARPWKGGTDGPRSRRPSPSV